MGVRHQRYELGSCEGELPMEQRKVSNIFMRHEHRHVLRNMAPCLHASACMTIIHVRLNNVATSAGHFPAYILINVCCLTVHGLESRNSWVSPYASSAEHNKTPCCNKGV